MKKTYILTGFLCDSLMPAKRSSWISGPRFGRQYVLPITKPSADILTALNGAYGALQFNGQYGQFYAVARNSLRRYQPGVIGVGYGPG